MTDQTIVGGEERARRAREVLADVISCGLDDNVQISCGDAVEAMLTFAAEASGIGVLREALEHADEWLTNLRHTRDCAWREDDHCDCGLTKIVRHIDEALAASISSREQIAENANCSGRRAELAERLAQAADDIFSGATIFSDRVHGLLIEAADVLSPPDIDRSGLAQEVE